MTEPIEDFRAGIAKRVRAHRKAKKYTQVKLVMKTGIAQTTISDIECRGKPFSLTVGYKLAHALGCTIHDLLPATSNDVAVDLIEVLAED